MYVITAGLRGARGRRGSIPLPSRFPSRRRAFAFAFGRSNHRSTNSSRHQLFALRLEHRPGREAEFELGGLGGGGGLSQGAEERDEVLGVAGELDVGAAAAVGGEAGREGAEAALRAGVDIVEMGTPLIKTEGVRNVVPAFRAAFPEAVLLADMKTMDGGAYEARAVFAGGGNIIDFLALAGVASARGICAVRDEFRAADPATPRLVFADILVPHQGTAAQAIDVAESMLEAGVDGVGVHLQLDARRADPALFQSGYLADAASAIFWRKVREGSRCND